MKRWRFYEPRKKGCAKRTRRERIRSKHDDRYSTLARACMNGGINVFRFTGTQLKGVVWHEWCARGRPPVFLPSQLPEPYRTIAT